MNWVSLSGIISMLIIFFFLIIGIYLIVRTATKAFANSWFESKHQYNNSKHNTETNEGGNNHE